MHPRPFSGTVMFLEASQNASRNMAPRHKALQGIMMFLGNEFCSNSISSPAHNLAKPREPDSRTHSSGSRGLFSGIILKTPSRAGI